MKPDPLDDALLGHPQLAELFALARRRRAARELAEEEFTSGKYADEAEPEEDVARLAAADVEAARFADGEIELDWRDGAVTLRRGPSGLALRVDGRLLPLALGVTVPVGGALPSELVVVDARGRRRVLARR